MRIVAAGRIKRAVRADFEALMKVASHYGQHRFLLGERASLGDFTFAGFFKAHVEADPELGVGLISVPLKCWGI